MLTIKILAVWIKFETPFLLLFKILIIYFFTNAILKTKIADLET